MFKLVAANLFDDDEDALEDTIREMIPPLAIIRDILLFSGRALLMDEETLVQRLLSLLMADLLNKLSISSLAVHDINRVPLRADFACSITGWKWKCNCTREGGRDDFRGYGH